MQASANIALAPPRTHASQAEKLLRFAVLLLVPILGPSSLLPDVEDKLAVCNTEGDKSAKEGTGMSSEVLPAHTGGKAISLNHNLDIDDSIVLEQREAKELSDCHEARASCSRHKQQIRQDATAAVLKKRLRRGLLLPSMTIFPRLFHVIGCIRD